MARDLQSVVLYDQEGQFVGVRRPGSRKPIQVNNVSIVVDDIIGSTGLELKVSFLHYLPLLTTMGLFFKTSGG